MLNAHHSDVLLEPIFNFCKILESEEPENEKEEKKRKEKKRKNIKAISGFGASVHHQTLLYITSISSL